MSRAVELGERLNGHLVAAGLEPLAEAVATQFGRYCELLLRWNAQTNLTAIRDEEGILTRHFLESIACARLLPLSIATLLDFGSGAGFPGIPIALCRPEIAVTLAESQNKKAAFLQETLRVLQLPAMVHAGRAETIRSRFDCVTLRAVDGMSKAIAAASLLVADRGRLAVLTTAGGASEVIESVAETGWIQEAEIPLAAARQQILLILRRTKEVF